MPAKVMTMNIYDGRGDKKAFPTNHTVAVVSAGKIVCGRHDFMTIRKSGREDFSLFYCEKGCLHFDDKLLKAGQVWIYAPKIPQKYVMYSKDNVIYRYLHFTGSDAAGLLSSLGIALSTALDITGSDVIDVFEHIQNNLSDESALLGLRAEYHVLYLLSRLAQVAAGPSQSHRMKRITDDMEHSFMKEYDAAYYADMYGLSISRFNHLFKDCIGVSPYAYYMQLRIANARSLLEDTDLKVKDIAEKCGYKDALYFTQAFKKETGMTPSAYRGAVGRGILPL